MSVKLKKSNSRYHNPQLTNEEKLKIMTEYMEKTGKPITMNTVYKGYNLGYAKNNLRKAYYSGTLKMDKTLLDDFINKGIISVSKERLRTPPEENYEFLMSMVGKSPEEISEAKSPSGLSYKEARSRLQLYYAHHELNLSDEQIENLKKSGIISPTRKEQKEIAKQYELPQRVAVDIHNEFNSGYEFLVAYKRGLRDYVFPENMFVGFTGITLSEKEITEKQKLAYAKLVQNICQTNINYSEGVYIDIDELDKQIEQLSDFEKRIIVSSYGLDGKTITQTDIAKTQNCSRSWIQQKSRKAHEILGSSGIIYTFLKSIQSDEVALETLEKVENDLKRTIGDVSIIKTYLSNSDGSLKSTINNVPLSELGISTETLEMLQNEGKTTLEDLYNVWTEEQKSGPENIPVSKINFSTRTKNCLNSLGLQTIHDIAMLSEEELTRVKNLGKKSLTEIINTLSNLGLRLRYQNEENNASIQKASTDKYGSILNQCNNWIENSPKKLEEIRTSKEAMKAVIERYRSAESFYLEKENLFGADDIVPPTSKIQENERIKRELIENIRKKQKELARLKRTQQKIEPSRTDEK